MMIIGILASIVLVVELTYYIFLIPDSTPLHVHPFDKYPGRAAYLTAYILSLLRAPLGLLPYLTKLFIFFVLKIRYESGQSTYLREVINMLGDFVNLGLTTALVLLMVGPPRLQLFVCILYLPIGAELVRLVIERVPITFSALWQLLPHRSIARMLLARQHIFWELLARCFARYCYYYSLSDIDRAEYVLHVLKQRARRDLDLSNRLEYIRAFRIIPLHHGLRSGEVRDVARGEVFIHGIWTNDPWLLVGMAIRRAPWMFDPRYLRRPFYYMTEANLLATLCVLEHGRYSLPYAVFQFGHEIRVARLHFFYALLRWSSLDIEEKVSADGTFQFDQFICWLEERFGHSPATLGQGYLYTDEEAIADMLRSNDSNEMLTAMEVAARYTYPLKYVEEILLEKISTARAEWEKESISG